MAQKNYTPIDHLIKKRKKPYIIPMGSTSRGPAKESEPIASSKEKYEIKEVVEHQPEEEVRPYLQPRAETIEIPPDLKRMGLQSTSTTQFPTYQNIKLPISDDKIISGLHQPITSSIRWLATLALYLLKQAHIALKVIHGKVIRVVK
ncbi:hypothetical protein HY357_00815 [Candidatus Roizmanbacteria bacterium]|nr:hypothetical protein [Candidatus Roizmanbacteria bacterium]